MSSTAQLFAKDVVELNLRYLQLAKLVVTAKDMEAMQALGLTLEDTNFFTSSSVSDLCRLAEQDHCLLNLRFTAVTLKSAMTIGATHTGSSVLQGLLALAETTKVRVDLPMSDKPSGKDILRFAIPKGKSNAV